MRIAWQFLSDAIYQWTNCELQISINDLSHCNEIENLIIFTNTDDNSHYFTKSQLLNLILKQL